MTKNPNEKNAPFEIISLLLKGYFSKEEIRKILGISNAGFYKSLNKLRKAGFDIVSSKIIYHIRGFNNKLMLDDYDISILANMISLCYLMLPEYKINSFKNLLRRFMFFAKKDDYNNIIRRFQFFKKVAYTSDFADKIKTLKTCISEKNDIKVTLHSGREIIMEPKTINWDKERIYLSYMNKNEEYEFGKKQKEKTISLERIAKIVEKTEEEYIPHDKEVVFELYGRLAESYLLKKEERIIDSSKDGTIVVANGSKNKEALFKRLLRYDTLCKIIFPKEDVFLFNQMIDKALSNLDISFASNSKQ